MGGGRGGGYGGAGGVVVFSALSPEVTAAVRNRPEEKSRGDG